MESESEPESFRDIRLDMYVLQNSPGISRSFAAKLIEDGYVRINDGTVLKAGYKLKPNDRVSISFDFESLAKIPKIDLDILYEDENCVVINKPAGLLTHSKGSFNPEPTVESWLIDRNPNLIGARAGIVHRLDRFTSGVMICAKSAESARWLQRQFSLRKVKKTYIAIVSGIVEPDHAIIDIPIGRNPKKPQTFQPGVNGKPSITEYAVTKHNNGLSMLELQPQTGRTHQLRVHLQHIGHPILGDTLYGGEDSDRLYLHALSLEITLFDRQRRTFTARLPKEFDARMKNA